MKEARIKRRDLIRGTTGTAVLAYLVPGWLVVSGPGARRAVALRALNDPEAASLLALIRDLFPHPGLGESFYAAALADLDAAMAKDPELRKQLGDGLARLDELAGGSWIELPTDRRKEVIQKIEQGAFFQGLWWRASASLYRNPAVWERFGYEGPSFSKGGYLTRGFDDIDWLPEEEPAAAAERKK